MKNNIAFMHSEPASLFVPRLPFRSPSQIKKNRLQWCSSDGLMWSCGSLGTSEFFFHNNIQASMSTPIKIWKGFLAHLFYFPSSSFIIIFILRVFPLEKKKLKQSHHMRWASNTVTINHHQLPLNRGQSPPLPSQLNPSPPPPLKLNPSPDMKA